MASDRKPAAVPRVPLVRAAARGERWWPVALAILTTALLHVALPTKARVNPSWLAPAILRALLAALILGDPGRIDRQKRWLRIVTGVVIAVITLANLFAAVRLVHNIITSNKVFANNATGLLATGGVILAANVIALGLWCCGLDRGGAPAPAHRPHADPPLVLPAMLHTSHRPGTR